MQVKTFSIPAIGGSGEEEEMNHFLRSHRITDISKQMVQGDGYNCWAFCVTYLNDNSSSDQFSGRKDGQKTDYRKVLSPEEFARFDALREFRNKLAQQQGFPPYNIFTNDELAEIARLESPDLEDLGRIKNIGKARVEKYGKKFCDMLASLPPNVKDNEEGESPF